MSQVVYKVMRKVGGERYVSCIDEFWSAGLSREIINAFTVTYTLRRVESGRGPYFCYIDRQFAEERIALWERDKSLIGYNYVIMECKVPKLWQVREIMYLPDVVGPPEKVRHDWLFGKDFIALTSYSSNNYVSLRAAMSLIPMKEVSS